jgi:hypothetical protein
LLIQKLLQKREETHFFVLTLGLRFLTNKTKTSSKDHPISAEESLELGIMNLVIVGFMGR